MRGLANEAPAAASSEQPHEAAGADAPVERRGGLRERGPRDRDAGRFPQRGQFQQRFPGRNEEHNEEFSLNQVTLLGRVGAIDVTGGGDDESGERQQCRIALATTNRITRKDGSRMFRTSWHRVVLGRPGMMTFAMNNIRRGDRLFVNGRLTYEIQRRMTGDEQVETRLAKIVANEIVNLSNSGERSQPADADAPHALDDADADPRAK